MPRPEIFLSHASADKESVKAIAFQLQQHAIPTWLDEWNLVPGEPWLDAVNQALMECSGCVVFLGPSGAGPWHHEEVRSALNRAVRNPSFRVIPVLLPGTRPERLSHLPEFLANRQWVTFSQRLDDANAIYQLVCGIRGVEPGPSAGIVCAPRRNPYRGLRVFDVEDAPLFFGREVLTQELLAKLKPTGQGESRFVTIVGPSGSGKSSLARAGLLAALRAGGLPGSAEWAQVILRPGADPLESLALAIAGKLMPSVDPGELIRRFRFGEEALHRQAKMALQRHPDLRVVLLVDQAEEAFTLGSRDDDRATFFANLVYAATVPIGPTVIVLAFRSDFYSRFAEHRQLAALVSENQVLVPPMADAELQRAITLPAEHGGRPLRPALVDELLADTKGRPGSLPLLEHALAQLWERPGPVLGIEEYRSIGKLAGALHARAEALFQSLPHLSKASCRRLFLRLVQPSENALDTRRRVTSLELPDDQREISQAFAAEGVHLLTWSRDGDREFLEVAHEELIRSWARLQQWIGEDRSGQRTHRRLTAAAAEWSAQPLDGRDDSLLCRGAVLEEIEQWLARLRHEDRRHILNRDEAIFLQQSRLARDLLRTDQERRAQDAWRTARKQTRIDDTQKQLAEMRTALKTAKYLLSQAESSARRARNWQRADGPTLIDSTQKELAEMREALRTTTHQLRQVEPHVRRFRNLLGMVGAVMACFAAGAGLTAAFGTIGSSANATQANREQGGADQQIQATRSAEVQRSIFTGRVLARGSGLPIAGAVVTFFLDGAHDVLTGADGTYRFEAPRPGTYELRRIAAQGFAPYETKRKRTEIQFVAQPGMIVSGINLELERLTLCHGTVARGGNLVAGARVQCHQRGFLMVRPEQGDHEHPGAGWDPRSPVGALVSEALTNEQGEFELKCAQWHELSVAGEAVSTIVGERPECDWNVDLEQDAVAALRDAMDNSRRRILSGRVLDEYGLPVKNARVKCGDREPGIARTSSRPSLTEGGLFASADTTDETGAFQCRVTKDKEVLVSIPGVASSERRFAANADHVMLGIRAAGGLRGAVRDFDGRPMSHFEIVATSSSGQRYEQTFISPDGSFALGDIVPDVYMVTAVQPGFPPSATERVNVNQGEQAKVTLILQEGLRVRGVVLDATTHRPIPGAWVSLPESDGPPGPVTLRKQFTATDANGIFALSRFVLDGADSLIVFAPGYNAWELGFGEAKLGEVTVALTPIISDARVEFGGVGMGVDRDLVVTYLDSVGPANHAGVSMGDRIVALDGRPAPEDRETVISQIRGPPGTQIEIQFSRPDGGVLKAHLRRERISN